MSNIVRSATCYETNNKYIPKVLTKLVAKHPVHNLIFTGCCAVIR